MTKKWVIPLLLLLPFVPLLFWGFYLTEPAYASLQSVQRITTWQELFADTGTAYQALSTPLFSIGVGLLSRLGFEPAPVAALLGALGWGVSAVLMCWIGRAINYSRGAFVAGVLFCLNPWIIATLGQATGWIIALIWLIANFLLRKRFVVASLGALFLLSLFFRPSQGFIWPNGLAEPLAWSLLLFAAAVGAEWLASYLTENNLIRLDQKRAATLFLGLLSLLIIIWQGNRLRQERMARPSDLWSVEEEIASWLCANTESEATLLAGERLAYLANREAVATSPEQLQPLLFEDAPDYVVSGSTIPWQMLREAIWFRLFYEPRQSFGDDSKAQTRKEVWAYRPQAAALGPLELLNARVPDRVSILGFQIDPQPAVSGQPINLALHLQAPHASLSGPAPFQAIIRLVSPLDGTAVGEWTMDLPRTIAVEEWAPAQVILEPLQISLPQELESAAYALDLSLTSQGEAELWPISLNNDVNRLDRIPLGYLTIPWTGSMDDVTLVTAGLAQGVQLLGFERGEALLGEVLEVTLYWQTSEAIADKYNVFVHLLDGDGQLVANHDGPPANGRFPTEAWLPGVTVPDTHGVPIPADLAPGSYEIRVGIYNPVTGERLPLQFSDGQPVEGDSVSLGVVSLDQ